LPRSGGSATTSTVFISIFLSCSYFFPTTKVGENSPSASHYYCPSETERGKGANAYVKPTTNSTERREGIMQRVPFGALLGVSRCAGAKSISHPVIKVMSRNSGIFFVDFWYCVKFVDFDHFLTDAFAEFLHLTRNAA